MAPQPLTNTEALLWTIERDPALRSTIMGIAVLKGPVDVDQLHVRIRQVTQVFPRLRQRVTRSARGELRWTAAANWDLEQHLTHVRLPGTGTMRKLLDLAGEQAGEAFDPARPLWHLTLLDGLEGDRSALMIKMHHSLTDGVGGVGLMWLLTDPEPHPDSAPDLTRPSRPKRARPTAVEAATSILASAVVDPVDTLRAAPRAARSAAKMVAPAAHALSPLTIGRGLDRHLDVMEVSLSDLERAGHAVGGTVNDAFMAAVVGGLRRYHTIHGAAPSELRVTMPISIRRGDDDPAGNRFTPARFTVPLGIDDPARRMEELGLLARQWRDEPAIGMTDVLAGALSRLPDAVTTSVFGSMLKGVDFVASNVPGSRARCWLAGAEVLQFYGFAPPSGSAMSITLLSHVGTCCIGVNVDQAAIDDPDVLRTSLDAGFAEVIAVGRSRRRRPARNGAKTDRNEPAGIQHAESGPMPRRLTALDTSFLEAETARTPMHLGALMLLDGEPLRDSRGELRMDAIRAEIEGRLSRSPRMRQVARHVPFARPEWEDDPTFDIAAHVHHVRVPAPGTRAELDALCCELQMELLDRTRPLWEMWFVDGLVDGRVGLVYKVHHAVVDGVSAAETFEVLLDRTRQVVSQPELAAPENPVRRLAGALIDDAWATTQLWLTTGARVATRPAIAARAAVELTRLVGGSLIAPHASLNRPIGDRRRLVPVTFDLGQLKAVGRRYEATVNDVVLTLVGAGLGALFAGRSEQVDHVRVLVPVSLRDDTRHDGVGNRVAALMVDLATERDPIAALPAVVHETRSRKAGPEAAALDLLLRSFDCSPVGLIRPVSREVVHHQPFVNLVVTNVRGAEQPLSLLGSKIVEIVPVIPLGGNLGLGIAVLSYAGQMVIGLHADAVAFPDLDLVADAMQTAFARLENPDMPVETSTAPSRRRYQG